MAASEEINHTLVANIRDETEQMLIIPELPVQVNAQKGRFILSYYIQEICYEPHLIKI